MNSEYSSWGLRPAQPHHVEIVGSRFDAPRFDPAQRYLPFGKGRSYGDSCLNTGNYLLPTTRLDHFIDFDPSSGELTCESGVTLDAILRLVVRYGWFLPVTPGTQFVTVGGAIANDVHGKNHHSAGTFGSHVTEFELLRSDGSILLCSRDSNPDFFRATVGGLGLTGLIRWARVRLKKISSTALAGESVKFESLAEFLHLSEESDGKFEYTVAWLDCTSRRGRGVFSRANHGEAPIVDRDAGQGLNVPFTAPLSLVNRLSVAAMNTAVYSKQLSKRVARTWEFREFFYPLDGIRNWNRLYGPRGFFQFQCVLPQASAQDSLGEILEVIRRSGQGSFLAVLKVFGDGPSGGLLSFPRPGVTLALDFPNRGKRTLDLMSVLEGITATAGGAIYPAKDATMTGKTFAVSFPRAQEFSRYIDPVFSSSFWRRVAV